MHLVLRLLELARLFPLGCGELARPKPVVRVCGPVQPLISLIRINTPRIWPFQNSSLTLSNTSSQ
jgi:hypothetical protein